MILYLDENLPKHLAEGFQILQHPEGFKSGQHVEVKWIPDEFGHGVKDVDWIPTIGDQKACVITQDININRRKHELELYRQFKVGMFFLKGASKKHGMTVWEMVQALAKNWPEITQIMYKEKRPFAFEITLRRRIKKL